MRAILMALAMSGCAPAWCAEDILDVLQRSQQMQLDALAAQEVDPASEASQVVQRSFDRVVEALNLRQPGMRLIVVRSPLLAVCLMADVLVPQTWDAVVRELFFLGFLPATLALGLGVVFLAERPGFFVCRLTRPACFPRLLPSLGAPCGQSQHSPMRRTDRRIFLVP